MIVYDRNFEISKLISSSSLQSKGLGWGRRAKIDLSYALYMLSANRLDASINRL